MGKEDQIGRRAPHVPRVWKEFNTWTKQTPLEVRVQGTSHGQWPEGTPQVFIDLYTKTTAEERLLNEIFGYPSVKEIQARPTDYVATMNAERAQQRRERLARRLGEPEDSTTTLEELEARNTLTLKDQVEQIVGTLSPRERRVLQGRFGIVDGKSLTRRELGEELSCSPRTIGRLERRALDKLKKPSAPELLI